MTQQELLTTVRQRLRDVVGTYKERLWEDAELINAYGNAARDKLFSICRNMIIDSTTEWDGTGTDKKPLCRITPVVGTSTYALSPKILFILRVKVQSQTCTLLKMTRDELDLMCPNWQAADNGVPWGWVADMDTDSISLIPAPDSTDKIELTVSRYPLTRLDINNQAATIGIREEYHEDLIPWIMYLALSKKDIETDNPQMAEFNRQLFLSRAEDIKLEVYQRYSANYTNRTRRAFLPR